MLRDTVTKIVQEVVLEQRSAARELARKIGKPYSTLMRELNPFDGGAKLGVDTLLAIMKTMHNVEPLRYMAEELGYGLVVKGKKRQESVRSSVAPKRDEETFVPSMQAAGSRRTVEQ